MNEDLTELEQSIHSIKSKNSEETSANINNKIEENQEISVISPTKYVKPIQDIDANDFYITIDKNKDYHE